MEIKELDNVQQLEVRALARAEVASFAGLVLRRVQLFEQSMIAASGEPDATTVDITTAELSHIFGEVLQDFGNTDDRPGV